MFIIFKNRQLKLIVARVDNYLGINNCVFILLFYAVSINRREREMDMFNKIKFIYHINKFEKIYALELETQDTFNNNLIKLL